MPDVDLDQELRDEFWSIAATVEPSLRLDGLVRQRIARRQLRRRLAAAGSATALGVVLVVGAVGILTRGHEDDVTMRSDEAVDGSTLYLVPGPFPSGLDMQLVHASGGDQPGVAGASVQVSDWDWTQRWTQSDGVVPAVEVQVSRRGPVQEALLAQADSAERVTVGEVEVLHWAVDGSLAWTIGDDLVVRIATVGDAVLPLERLQPFVEGLVVHDDGNFDMTPAPEGFDLGGEWPAGASEGTNARTLAYQASDGGAGFQVHIVDNSGIPPVASLQFAGVTVIGTVDIDGSTGWWLRSPGLVNPPRVDDPRTEFVAEADLYLQYLDPATGARVTISSVGLDEDDLMEIASGLERVDATTWFALQGRGDPEVATPTTPTTPDDEVTFADPRTPAAAAESVSGTFDGTEHYSLTDEPDCEVHSIYDGIHTLSDGTTWQYHADYCGTLGDDIWSSEGGAVAITPSDGSTLAGTMDEQSVPMDSDGQPFSLSITGGTGAYATASGFCEMDNHLIDTALGTQEHYGTFTCTLTR